MGIIDESRKELTEGQKDYKTKIWPKHYIPHQKELKAEQLDLVGAELGLKIGGRKEGNTR